jgi:hypothetical protein
MLGKDGVGGSGISAGKGLGVAITIFRKYTAIKLTVIHVMYNRSFFLSLPQRYRGMKSTEKYIMLSENMVKYSMGVMVIF